MRDVPAVDAARYYAFARKIPLFCLVMSVLTVSKIAVFAGSVPSLHGVVIPVALGMVATVAGIRWSRMKHHRINEEEARHELNKATALLFLACYVTTANDLALYYFADHQAGSDERHFVLMLLLGEGVCSFFFLMHLRKAALLMAGLSIIPSLVLYASDGTMVGWVTTINITVLALAMMIVMLSYARDYASLAKSHLAVEALGEENARLAAIDMVTNLPNRREFFRELGVEVDRFGAEHDGFSIGIVDLDGFKLVNDTHGHKFGDLVLARVANRLKECVGPEATFYRLGGDEFVFIHRAKSDEDALLALTRTMIDSVLMPLDVGSITTTVGCSIGVARFPQSASDAELLYEYCDYALYNAKRGGRQRSVVFSDEHRRIMLDQGATEQALRAADLELELYPVFQPITDSRTGGAVAYECLARWNSPALGPVSPAKFIPVAEQCGLVSNITKVMLRKALFVMKDWDPDTKLSLNLSPHDVGNDVLVLELFSIIEKSGVRPNRIGFELTETALLQNFDGARRNIEFLRMSGIGVALDDFGAGYSSLSHIHALPLDKLKIDRRFIADVEHNETSRNIIRSVAGLCQDLGIECIVEGAETQAQVDALGALGCNFVQGYFYSKPMTSSQLQAYVAAGESRGKMAVVA